jgi:YidC/Oxa1 family membrane protein insertase
MSESKNLFLAVILSIAVLFGFNYFYERPKLAEMQSQSSVQVPPAHTVAPAIDPTKLAPRKEVLDRVGRIAIETPKLKGSINLQNCRFDDLTLLNYKESTDANSPPITLLTPEGAEGAYFIDTGWLDSQANLTEKGVWQAKNLNQALTPQTPVTLYFDQGSIHIERTISVDDNYLFTITDTVVNQGTAAQVIRPYGRVSHLDKPKTQGFYVLHEGAVGVVDGKLKEFSYDNLASEKSISQTATGAWVGFTDKYWLAALIPDQKKPITTRFSGHEKNHTYTSEVLSADVTLAPRGSIHYTQHVFAGAKILRLLDQYEEKLGVGKFDLAVDFGWFYFVTKPLFYVLEFLSQLLGNLGVAILVLTVLVKALLYPFANKSFKSMARMKVLQPEMEKIKQRYGHDKIKMNQELMAFYQKQKINPASGCLPMLVQAPILFCLYKVFFVTIELRHAPFFWWIHDLSAPDPTSIFNLFGLLPFTPPSFLMIGALPLFMGATMVWQQRMNPQPADPAQAKVMMIMPIMFTFLFASFPAGLVLYWAWGNLLNMAQQWYITYQNTPKK